MARTISAGRQGTEGTAVRKDIAWPYRLSPALALLVLLAACAAALWLRVWPLHNFSIDYQDEGAYWQSLRAMAAGHPLFSSVFSSQPPFFLLGLYPFYLLFGQTIVAARLGVELYSLLGLGAVYVIGRVTAGRWAGVIALVLLVADPLYLAESHTVQAEMPSLALALAGVALAAIAMGQTGPRRHCCALLSGVAIGLGILTKIFDVVALVPSALYLVAPLCAAFAGDGGRLRASRRTDMGTALRLAVLDLALLCVGLAVAGVAVLAPFASVLGLVYDQAVRFHLVAAQIHALNEGGLSGNVVIIRNELTSMYAAPYLVLILVGLLVAAWRRAWRVAPPFVWLVISLGLLVHQQPLIDHHVVLLAPALALIAGSALPLAFPALRGRTATTSLCTETKTKGARRWSQARRVQQDPSPIPSRGGRIGAGVVSLVVLALVVVSALTGLRSSVEADRSPVFKNPPPPEVQLAMARALRERTKPGELIVTDGQYAAALANRSVPPQLVDTSYVRIDAGGAVPRYFSLQQLEDITTRDHVRTILFATWRLDMLPFRPWVVSHGYRKVASFGGSYALYQR